MPSSVFAASMVTALSQERPRDAIDGAAAGRPPVGWGGGVEEQATKINAAATATRMRRMLSQYVAHFLLRPHVERPDRTDGDVHCVAHFVVAKAFHGDELAERARAG